MGQPEALFLKGRDGGRVGPVAVQWLEIMFDARVIDELTPISTTGKVFRPLEAWPDLLRQLRAAREGKATWSSFAPRPEEPGGGREALMSAVEDPKVPPLRALLKMAAQRADGTLSFARSTGEVRVSFRDGKISEIQVEPGDLSLESSLQRTFMIDDHTLQEASEQAPSFGGDLGAALVAGGRIPGEAYFEALVNWALSVIAQLTLDQGVSRKLNPDLPPSPPVPLAFERIGVFLDAIRTLSRAKLSDRMMPHRSRPIVLSQFDGVERSQLQLKPKELRVLNQINGARTLKQLLEEQGTNDDSTLAILRMLFFATETGMAVLGEDPEYRQEKAEAEALAEEIARIEKANPFEVLGIKAESANEQVRQAYTDLARRYHPDGLRQDALPELRRLREQLFSSVGEAFSQVDTDAKRRRLEKDLAESSPDRMAEQQEAQKALVAETLYKKAEVLVRVRKLSEARDFIDQAVELRPKETDYKAYAIYVRYLQQASPTDPALGAASAIEELLEVLRDSGGESVVPLLHLAQLHKAVGRNEAAVSYWQRILDLDPDHVEAKSEVRIAQLRRAQDKNKRSRKGWLG